MARPGAKCLALALVAGLAVGPAVGPALAGDRALLDLIGYSADGQYFALEEFGIQDGSGFPYSTIYVIDLKADRWVADTPVRVRFDDEQAPLAAVRAAARTEARLVLEDFAIHEPAHLIALNGDGEPGDATILQFGAVSYLGSQVQDLRTLELEVFATGSPHDCTTFLGEDPKGYALLLHGGGTSRELHRDGATLPRSRGCATGYDIYAVVARPDTGTLDDAVAILSVYPFGFEGPDRRFLAVPLGE